jgi:hypothetical protein
LKGSDKPVRETSVNCASSGLPSVRQGPWKLIAGSGSGGWSKGKEATAMQLYNLADDLGESKNLFNDQPERVQKMRELLEKTITDGRSTPGARQKNDQRVRRFGGTEQAEPK